MGDYGYKEQELDDNNELIDVEESDDDFDDFFDSSSDSDLDD